jgi:hypothetical protein
LLSRMRKGPDKLNYMGEGSVGDSNEAGEIAEEAKRETVEISSLLIQHLNPQPLESRTDRGEQWIVNQDRYGSDITSDLKIGLSEISIDATTNGSKNELMESLEIDILSERHELEEPSWNNKKANRAVPLIQIRF